MHRQHFNVFINVLQYVCALWRQVVEDGYEFFAKRQLVTLFSAPNYCGEFDNAGGMMSVDDTLMCSFQVRCVKRLTLLQFHVITPLILASDIKTVRKESQVSVWRPKLWTPSDSAPRPQEVTTSLSSVDSCTM